MNPNPAQGATPRDPTQLVSMRVCRNRHAFDWNKFADCPYCKSTPAQREELNAAPQDNQDHCQPNEASPVPAGAASVQEADAGLVERLRKHFCRECGGALCGEAADTIAALQRQVAELKELHVMQLAGISTVSIENTRRTVKNRIGRNNPYWSVAYDDVCVAIDREMRERERADAAESELQAARRDADRYKRLRENWIDCDELGLHGRLSVIDAIVDAAIARKGK